MKNLSVKTLSAAVALLALASCKKDPVEPTTPQPQPQNPVYTVPTTYNFSNADYDSSTAIVGMQKELITYIRTAHKADAHVVLDQTKMQNMFANTGNPFADASLNSSGISMMDNTSNSFGLLTDVSSWLADAAAASQNTAEATDGTAGKMLGPVPTAGGTQSAWLLNANGFEFKELVEKGLMGALLYSEAMERLSKIADFDNATKQLNGITAQEQAWDEAFGFFAVPADFPATTTGLSYWGNYCNSVNAAIGSNTEIMNAFLKGRAALSNRDYTVRDQQRDIVMSTWEKVGAAKLIAYLKQAKNATDAGPRHHQLSEAYGFIGAFRYNPSKKISDAEITELFNLLGDNLYNVSINNIDAMITKVSGIFGIDSAKL